MSEPYPPYEPEETYEWDYDDRPRPGGKILWGRVLALAVALFLAFLLGRGTAPSSGAPASRIEALQDEIDQLQKENDDLQGLLAEPSPSPTTIDTTDNEDDTAVQGETYVVERGDTLRGIAETFCGDASFDDVIAEANGIEDAGQLSVGAELVIPADCGE